MRFGLGRLRLPPDQFWATTLQEFGAAILASLPPEAPRIHRDALDALIAAFPDQEDQNHG